MKKRSLIVLGHLKMGPLIRKTKQETSNVKMVIINLVIYAFQESTVGLRVYFKFLTVYCYRYRYIKKCRKLVSLLINILLKKMATYLSPARHLFPPNYTVGQCLRHNKVINLSLSLSLSLLVPQGKIFSAGCVQQSSSCS